jgi:hypothetical protein
MNQSTPGHGEPGHEHDLRCLLFTSVNWVYELNEICQAIGAEMDPNPILSYAAHAIASTLGYILTPEDFKHMSEQAKGTLPMLVQMRMDAEFKAMTQG